MNEWMRNKVNIETKQTEDEWDLSYKFQVSV